MLLRRVQHIYHGMPMFISMFPNPEVKTQTQKFIVIISTCLRLCHPSCIPCPHFSFPQHIGPPGQPPASRPDCRPKRSNVLLEFLLGSIPIYVFPETTLCSACASLTFAPFSPDSRAKVDAMWRVAHDPCTAPHVMALLFPSIIPYRYLKIYFNLCTLDVTS
jgi:hypothetical protein